MLWSCNEQAEDIIIFTLAPIFDTDWHTTYAFRLWLKSFFKSTTRPAYHKTKNTPQGVFSVLLAERKRFELLEGSPPRRFSRPLH